MGRRSVFEFVVASEARTAGGECGSGAAFGVFGVMDAIKRSCGHCHSAGNDGAWAHW